MTKQWEEGWNMGWAQWGKRGIEKQQGFVRVASLGSAEWKNHQGTRNVSEQWSKCRSSAVFKEVSMRGPSQDGRPLQWWREICLEQAGAWCIIWTPPGRHKRTVKGLSARIMNAEGKIPIPRPPRLLADQTCRLLMMKKVAGVCVQIAHDEVPVSWNVSVRGITHAGNPIEVATKRSLTKNSIYSTSHYVSEAAERSIYLAPGSTLHWYLDSCCFKST